MKINKTQQLIIDELAAKILALQSEGVLADARIGSANTNKNCLTLHKGKMTIPIWVDKEHMGYIIKVHAWFMNEEGKFIWINVCCAPIFRDESTSLLLNTTEAVTHTIDSLKNLEGWLESLCTDGTALVDALSKSEQAMSLIEDQVRDFTNVVGN